MKLSRRQALKIGLIGGSSLALALGVQSYQRTPANTKIEPFERSLIIPPLLKPIRSDETTDYYEITLQKSSTEILPGLKTEIWGYNGIAPGPTIRQSEGRKSVIRFINKLGKDSQGKPINNVIHVHGMATSAAYDGYTTDYIPPDYFKDYIYPNERASILWYHDHTMDLTARNVDAGLAGMYIVEEPEDLNLPLPKGNYDIPLILQTKRFAQDGSIIFYNQTPDNLYGNVLLVNGVPSPKMEVARRKYRFRILNASGGRNYQLALSQKIDSLTEGEKLIVIGSDGGLLSEPVEIVTPEQVLPVVMAERYDVIIDFSKYPLGTEVFLQNVIQGLDFSGSVAKNAQINPIMRFDVVRSEADESEIPRQLRPVERLSVTSNIPERTFIFRRNQQGKWAINGKTWDENRIDAHPQSGAVEIWHFINPEKGMMHPIHLHLVEAQLLDRNGEPPRPFERGWKDVFLLNELEELRIVARFKGSNGEKLTGKFMMHCHQLLHEDRGMMSQFEVGDGGLDPVATAPAQPLSIMRSL
ncbi:multicopper oxidase family protein [Gloeothece verrucosa]|uniref:Multicopper oxidase CueO n=1 Tax=Gloeothece verrucosa (strain PCC 7822) TaxID=497965 RepID=E0UJG6_GLOV7|nr:multicopper oxidase domain-containing protein [Gloeothece verrucosa]ADN16984.1 Bilirubin oxidase [Gloeothece verrucosa PCC 7822]